MKIIKFMKIEYSHDCNNHPEIEFVEYEQEISLKNENEIEK